MDKEGVFTGCYASHPVTNDKIPVWAGNFVVADYGSGMVMAVPAHDQRDFDFAKKYKIPVKLVISEEGSNKKEIKAAYEGVGKLVNSGAFDDLDSVEAKEHITNYLKEKKLGKKTVQYKLRDWLVSRQRYWGTPIPIVYCDSCGIVPINEKDLPVLLPEDIKFGEGNPLLTSKKFVDAKCPNCGKIGRRETDTMDTFFDSSWYYLRFTDANNKKEPFNKKNSDYWMPVDFYTGGAEHACMHLIYARFFSKVLRDLGYVKYDEPFKRLYNQGMIHGEDGFVMSKSRGNVVDPMEMINKYGADSLRLFLVSIASPDKDFTWSSTGVESSWKFVKKAYDYVSNVKIGKSTKRVEHKINLTLKKVSEEIEYLRYNIAVIRIRELFDSLEDEISKADLEKVVKMLSLFCPHVSEELWEKIGGKGFVCCSSWPDVEEKKIDESFETAEKSLEKTVADILNVLKIIKEKQGLEGKKVYLYVIPNELDNYNSEILTKRVGKEVNVYAVNDKKKYDPQGKSGKTKPGKPGIYIE
jgi:leucyl-tRNA synthetase